MCNSTAGLHLQRWPFALPKTHDTALLCDTGGEEIDKRKEVFLADLIRMVPSVAIAERGFKQVAVNTRGGCAFQIVLDGFAISLTPNLRDLPSPKELAGIEIYSGPATVPVQYK